MSFNYIEYPAIGESYRSPSLPASAQRLVNMYPEAIKGGGLTQIVAHNFPGLKTRLTGNAGEFDRGLHVFKGNLYQVAGSQLYLVSSGYVRTAIGSISGTGRVSIADNGNVMVIVTGGDGEYTYDGATFSAVTLGQNPTNVEYLNSQFFYDDDDGRIGVSEIGGTTVPSGNYFTPESNPDELVRTYVYNQFIYVFGQKSIEPWQPGVGLPPVERMNGAIIEDIGLASQFAIDSTTAAIYFIDDDGNAQQVQGFQPKQISTVAIANEWKGYTLNDAIVETVTIQALDFVLFMFPTNGKTWCYVEQYDMWLELEHSTNKQRWRGNSIVEANGRRVVADYATGNLYELDPDTYTDNNQVTVRERIFAPLAGEKFGKPRQRFQLNEIGISLETGIGTTAELDPKLAISVSSDGGKTFSNERFKRLGAQGEFVKDVKYSTNKHFKDLTVKLRYTEPTKFSLFDAYVKLREAGRQ